MKFMTKTHPSILSVKSLTHCCFLSLAERGVRDGFDSRCFENIAA